MDLEPTTAMTIDTLRERIRAVVLERDSIAAFEEWLVATSWNMHQWAPPEIQRLVSYLELRLAERSSAHLSDNDLRTEFAVRLARLDSAPLFHVSIIGDASLVFAAGSASSVRGFRFSYSTNPEGAATGESAGDARTIRAADLATA